MSETTVVNDRLLREIVAAARDGDAAWVEVWCGDVAAEVEELRKRVPPPGTVAVEREWLARLVEYVASHTALEMAAADFDDDAYREVLGRFQAAAAALLPGDAAAGMGAKGE